MTSSTESRQTCCAEFATRARARHLGRRAVLGGALAGGVTATFGSAVLTASPALAASPVSRSGGGSVLVVLSLRGAADGLSLVVPYTDPVYYAARPAIAIPRERLLATDGTFGLHPELAPLLPLWRAGELAAVHATGLPAPNRSHFSAMEEVEDADPGGAARVGWLNRLLGGLPGTSGLEGFNLGGGVLPTSLVGPEPVMAGRDVDAVGFAGQDEWDDGSRVASLRRLWSGQGGALGAAMRSTFDSVAAFQPAKDAVDRRGQYPDSDLGRALAGAARIIRGDVGVGVLTVDHGSWDMHAGLGTLEWGDMRTNARELAGAVASFFTDLGSRRDRVTLVALSEFGRRVAENGNYGLDHGYGNVMLLAGAGVRGGRYYGRMLPLARGEDADVTVTTDYRSVLSEVVTRRFAVSRAAVFPGFQPEAVGVMA
ncbi:DUF1501 domain-containing protein [Nocardioides sp. R-C-SC26]|uniref:DUF1501 domain-containing protein n=1 Tax=Nocardioides sp. R-C-SC26 TaxID=2870414 RepID=UPI001E43E166|nr:DUF1501 domain-containing protein [Nocardioides sp. R-C-SC26]